MGIGKKLKEYRVKEGLTQKELADKLHITYQAVSRWENDEAEPSFDMLKDICEYLHCTTDDLFGIEKEENNTLPTPPVEKVQIVEKVIVQPQEQVLALCESCNKPIFNSNEIFRIEEKETERVGRTSHYVIKKRVLCAKCNQERLDKIKKEKDEAEKALKAKNKNRRIHSFIWPSLSLILFIVLSIVSFKNGNTSTGVTELVIGVLSYTFFATMILNNTFLTDMWAEISSWGFVKMPGIIFSLSFDGLIFLIAVKILFFIIGIGLALAAVALATGLALALSIFVYPFALSKNFKGIEKTDN